MTQNAVLVLARQSVVFSVEQKVVGSHSVTITANDGRGGSATQVITIPVTQINATPSFTSSPTANAVVGQPWTYVFAATDLNDAPASLVYSIDSPTLPANGIAFNASTRTSTWNPAGTTPQSFTLLVTDPQGAFDLQSFTIAAGSTAPTNAPPIIRSSAPRSVRVGKVYSYPVNAFDPDGQAVTWALPVKPAGAAINSSTGVITWAVPPATALNSLHTFKVEISDGSLSSYMNYQVQIREPNRAPVLTDIPNQVIAARQTFRYDAYVTDLDGDVLTYSLDAASGTRGMTINANGQISFTASTSHIVTPAPTVTVTVSDGRLSATDTFTLAVTADTTLPTVTLTPSRTLVPIGDFVNLRLLASP